MFYLIVAFYKKHLDCIMHEQTIICKSCGGPLANEREEERASNDNKACFT